MADLEEPGSDGCIAYLSANDTAIYEEVRSSTDPKDMIIKGLLERIAKASRLAHQLSRY